MTRTGDRTGPTAGRRARRGRWAVAVVTIPVVLLAAAGCSSSSDDGNSSAGGAATSAPVAGEGSEPGSGGTGVDPCSLLAPADLEAATGLSFGDGVYNDTLSNDAFSVCDWTTTGSEFATAQVLVAEGSDSFSDQRSSADEAVGPVLDVTVAGAQAAYQTEEGSVVGMDLGGTFLQVSYIPPGPGNVNEATLELAAVAVANLADG